MKNSFPLLLLFLSIFFLKNLNGQDTIYLNNPSFEDIPRAGTPISPPIKGWFDCGKANFPNESPPDIMPTVKPTWGVNMKAVNGESYLGLVVRDNHTWESLSQALSTPIMEGKCYSFSAFITKSQVYKSRTKRSDTLENFVRPALLVIWGGSSFCDKAELLSASPPVSNTDWKKFNFLFEPKKTYTFITIEAFYNLPAEPYNGHILVDGLSPIIETNCFK
jgi:hypothetical protein